MKIRLLILTPDMEYASYLSGVLSDKYNDTFEVVTYSSKAHFAEATVTQHFDMALIAPSEGLENETDLVTLPLLLADEEDLQSADIGERDFVIKYQKISAIVSDLLGKYAQISQHSSIGGSNTVHITAVWSPAGGCGKTTVALAYAARCVASGKKALYLDLENFSSCPVYFQNDGKSISDAFENLEANLEMLLQSIRMQDMGSGIHYFCQPKNYDDMNVLTPDDVKKLVEAAAHSMDEVVIDLPSSCGANCRKVFQIADSILVVADSTQNSRTKLGQFMTQHNLFEQIRNKSVLVCNMGSHLPGSEYPRVVSLPFVRADNPTSTYKTLSANAF